MDPLSSVQEIVKAAADRKVDWRYGPGDDRPAFGSLADNNDARACVDMRVTDDSRSVHAFGLESGDDPVAFFVRTKDAGKGNLGAGSGCSHSGCGCRSATCRSKVGGYGPAVGGRVFLYESDGVQSGTPDEKQGSG